MYFFTKKILTERGARMLLLLLFFSVSKYVTILSELNCNKKFTGNPGTMGIKYTNVFCGKAFVRMRITG
jgi:hypothetical protein